MNITVNSDLQNFLKYAEKAAAGQAVEMGRGGEVAGAQATAGFLGRLFHVTSGARTAIDTNNRTRELFVEALKRQFNATDFDALPDAVKAALTGSHACHADGDFAFDAQGRATSGKPLTARRVMAVMTAIDGIQKAERANPAPVAPATVDARRTALAGHIEALLGKLTTAPRGHHVPVVTARFASAARTVLTREAFLDNLAKIGTGAKNTMAKAREYFMARIASCGVFSDYWVYQDSMTLENGERFTAPGKVGRDRVIEGFFAELVRDFNAAHPELALR